jgi:hypothetical protein
MSPKFDTVGQTVMVRGRVVRRWREGGDALLDLELWSEADGQVTVGPGMVTLTLPEGIR